MKPKTSDIFINLLAYQTAWFSCVFGAAYDRIEISYWVCAGALILNTFLSRTRYIDWTLVLITGVLGGLFESLVLNEHWVIYKATAIPSIAPIWIILLWMVFGTTLNHSLHWLQRKLTLSVLFGLLGGPVAWYAGSRIGALELVPGPVTYIVIGLGWAILMPLLAYIAQNLNARSPLSIDSDTPL